MNNFLSLVGTVDDLSKNYLSNYSANLSLPQKCSQEKPADKILNYEIHISTLFVKLKEGYLFHPKWLFLLAWLLFCTVFSRPCLLQNHSHLGIWRESRTALPTICTHECIKMTWNIWMCIIREDFVETPRWSPKCLRLLLS